MSNIFEFCYFTYSHNYFVTDRYKIKVSLTNLISELSYTCLYINISIALWNALFIRSKNIWPTILD